MSVTLRCPSCGTSGNQPGDCEVCNEAQLRFFCDQHAPGLWLDAPRCPRCGDAFGAESKPRPVTVRPPPSRSSTPVRVPRATPPPARAVLRRSSVRHSEPPFIEPPAPAWQQLLKALIRSRHAPPPATLPARGRATAVRGIAGCLMRLVVLALLLGLALVIAAFVFGRALLQGLSY